jgi:hypothetical protein
MSYSIQYESTMAMEGLDGEDATTTRKESVPRKASLKQLSIKVDEEAKQPLLLKNDDEEELEKQQSDVLSMLSSPRVAKNARGVDLKKRRTTNLSKMVSENLDKKKGNKAEMLKEQREADEMAKRKLEMQREKDAQDLKNQLGQASVKNVIMPQYAIDERL